MESSYYIIFMLFLILFITRRNNENAIKTKLIKNKKFKNPEERAKMFELAQRFIGKECLIYTFNSQLTGVIKEVTEGAILLQTGDSTDAVNFDYIVRIREYPLNKNGKKKSIILD